MSPKYNDAFCVKQRLVNSRQTVHRGNGRILIVRACDELGRDVFFRLQASVQLDEKDAILGLY